MFFSKETSHKHFSNYGSVALLSHNTLKWSAILGLSFFAQCWWPRESVLWGSSAISEFRTSLSKVLTLWHCVKVKQRYLSCSKDHCPKEHTVLGKWYEIYNYFLFAREVILLHSTSGERSEPQVLCKSITSQAKR